MFEPHNRPLLSRRAFTKRMGRQLAFTLGITALSLGAGMWGYHATEGMGLVDSFLNTAMILGGMGQVDPLKTEAGKIFAGVYALYSGFFLVVCGGLLLAPVFHRILHSFHAES